MKKTCFAALSLIVAAVTCQAQAATTQQTGRITAAEWFHTQPGAKPHSISVTDAGTLSVPYAAQTKLGDDVAGLGLLHGFGDRLAAATVKISDSGAILDTPCELRVFARTKEDAEFAARQIVVSVPYQARDQIVIVTNADPHASSVTAEIEQAVR